MPVDRGNLPGPNERKEEAQKWAQEKAALYQSYVRTSAWGLELGLSVVAGSVGGFYLGRWLGHQTAGLVIGFSFGVAAAAKRLVEITRIYLKEQDEDPPDEASGDEKSAPDRHDQA
jgi:hypothetical protein